MSAGVTIALDVGGTKVAGALIDRNHSIVARAQRSTLVDGRRDPALRVTRAIAHELAGRAAELGLDVDGLCVQAPSPDRTSTPPGPIPVCTAISSPNTCPAASSGPNQ